MNRPEALFLDIDGTILKTDHSLSPRVAAAIAALRDAGTTVCLATGRSWESLKPLYDELGLDGPTICYNGAFIVEGPEGRRVFEADLDEEVGRAVIAEARSRGLEMVAYRHSKLFCERRGSMIEGYRIRTGISADVVDFDEFESLEFTKCIMIGDPDLLPEIKDDFERRFPAEILSVFFSDATFLEFMAGGVNKGRGLREVCRIHGIDVSESVAMGDFWNDLPLLQAAGDAWVMGGAPDDLKALFPADRIAPASDEDGAALVMEAMLQGREGPVL